MEGRIFDCKRFAIHDGPGIRTTVFFKGCPLRCVWCHNPEGIPYGKGIWVKEERCVRCGSCVAVCGEDALGLVADGVEIDRSRCTYCGSCIEACPTRAIQRIGRVVEVEELAEELLRDKVFAGVSGGGVTLSGGEPLSQPEFALTLLKSLKAKGVDTCMETSMFAPYSVVSSMAEHLDHLLADIKLIDSNLHQRYTGQPNEQILKNFHYLSAHCKDVQVRIPLIPGITATEENLAGIARFVDGCAPGIPIELINYNPLAPSKYRFLREEYYNTSARAFSLEEMVRFAQIVEQSRKGANH